MSHYSVVEYFAEHEGYHCGYCKSPNTNYSHGMWAHSLTVSDYQDLVDRGWRRSGKYCYKPTTAVTCCPMYTIKCNALDFTLSKSQKKILKKMQRFLIHGRKEPNQEIAKKVPETDSDEKCESDCADSNYVRRVADRIQPDPSSQDIKREKTVVSEETLKVEKMESIASSSVAPVKETVGPFAGSGADPSKPLRKKAKVLRQERKLQKLLKTKREDAPAENSKKVAAMKNKEVLPEQKSLEYFLADPEIENPAHKLEIRLVRAVPPGRECDELLFAESYNTYLAYQVAIHNDDLEKCSQKQFLRFLVNSPLQVRLVPCNPQFDEFEKTLAASYSLYTSYQTTIHKETLQNCDMKTFTDFLVTSPLEEEESHTSVKFGSFHQQYWLDDKLIAVGVIDILPKLVSSVYLFYDPDYSFLSLGTYAALREVAFVRKLNRSLPELKHYYMGFYIHSCIKMRYKANFQPSFLLCPETYTWHPYEKCKLKLDVAAYSRFEDDENTVDEDSVFKEDSLLVLHARKVMPYVLYKNMTGNDDRDEVQQYARLVGQKCYRRMLLFRS